MQPRPDPAREADGGAGDSGGGSAEAGRPLQRGLLSRLSGSFGAAASAAAAVAGAAAGQPGPPADRDLEQPLLPGSQTEEEQYVAHNLEHKRWPELRLSSLSTRRLSPSMLSPTASSEGWGVPAASPSSPPRPTPIVAQRAAPAQPRGAGPSQAASQPLLSPRGSGGGFASPFTPALQTPATEHHAAAPFHTTVLDHHADAEPLFGAAADGAAGGPGGRAKAAAGGAAAAKPEAGRYTRAAITGCVNSVVTLPVMLSFAAIIFQDPFFRPLLGSLVKLVFLSSALHQAAFAALSSMPFAVGQVQDVGLIFLSAMASAVVQQCGEAGWGEADTLATVLATLTLATAVVGVLIVGTGALRLAGLVQYVPLPVVGGYLCFVGYFCLAAGVSLATGLHIGDLSSWAQLASRDALLKLAPALAMVLLITAVLHRVRSPFALPALLLAAPALFYGVLAACSWSLADARAAGWVTTPQPGDGDWRFWRAWSLYGVHDFPPSNILWAAMPGQLGKLLTLYFIVAFGSSMDIAAIQADTPRDLDYNSELVTVGLSNALTAVCGVGYTGSYIFSQTLFGSRMGVDSRLMGAILTVAELAVFMVPFNVMTYLPSFYFGGVIAWIGQDILKDWLFIAAKRVSAVEYCLLLATFGLVMAFGLEGGIAAGIVLAALHFAYSYSKVTMTAFTVVPSRSGAVRTFDQRTVLDMFSGRITAVSLSGYLFFGSSVNVLDRVLEIARTTLDSQPHMHAGAIEEAEGQQRAGRLPRLPSVATLRKTYDGVQQLMDGQSGSGGAQLSKIASALAESPRFLILDFRRVQGLDATAARSFVTLHNKLHRMGIQLIITHITARNANVRELLAAQGLVLQQPGADWQEDAAPVCAWFPTMDAGCQHCEERFLAVAVAHGLCPPPAPAMTLAQVLQANLDIPRCMLGEEAANYDLSAALLQRFARKHELRAGSALFQLDDPSDALYIIERGTVACHIDFVLSSVASRAQLPSLPADLQPQHAERVVRCGPGSVVGEVDFMLQRPCSFSAVVEASGSAWRIDRQAFEQMATKDAFSLALLQQVVLRSTCLSAAHAREALERASHAN